MINLSTIYGKVTISENYVKQLIANALTTCYGVAGTESVGVKSIMPLKKFTKNSTDGITVSYKDNKLSIDVNIVCVYGVNISVITRGVVEKINSAINDNLNIMVDSLKVHVADIAV